MALKLTDVTRRTLAVDVALVLAVLGLSLGIVAARGLGTPSPDDRHLDPLAILLVTAAALPLIARRIAPLSVYAATSLASLTLLALDYALDVPLAPLVALYQVAVAFGGSPRPAQRCTAIAAAVAFVPAVAAAYAVTGEHPRLAPELLALALMVAGAWIAGDRTRLRFERIADLEDRARRSELDAQRERRLAAAEERTRIARELHDSAGHAISVILVQAGAARLLHERDPDRSRSAIETIEDVARDTIGEIDQLVRALRDDNGRDPPPADPAALDELIDRYRAAGLDVSADLDGSRRALPRSVAWATYRIIQEALTNAARHGRGRAQVTVRCDRDDVRIAVANPVATGGSTATVGGHGIVGMRERATLLGGSLEASIEHRTFRLEARLPHREGTS